MKPISRRDSQTIDRSPNIRYTHFKEDREMTISMMITAILTVLAAMTYSILRNTRRDNAPPEPLTDESLAARYRPMFRLLDEADCNTVNGGFHSRISLWRFRFERRSLFRAYLLNLGADHARIVAAIRDLLVQSELDRPDLAKALCQCRIRFAMSMFSVECNLLRHTLGIGTVDVRGLVNAVEGLQVQFQDMLFVQAVSSNA
jgi:hypothetical protein